MTAKEAVLTIPGFGRDIAPAREQSEAATSAAWEAAVCGHARMIYRIAFSVLRNHHDAEDAVQETLQRAWKYRSRFDEIENPAAWLARISWRVAKSRRARPGMVSLDDLGGVVQLRATGVAADELACDRQLQRLMNQLIQHLPAKLRQPLILSTVDELSAREVGFILGIPEASVRSRCLRARRLLREKMSTTLSGGTRAAAALGNVSMIKEVPRAGKR